MRSSPGFSVIKKSPLAKAHRPGLSKPFANTVTSKAMLEFTAQRVSVREKQVFVPARSPVWFRAARTTELKLAKPPLKRKF
jgi:hypothetical protein